jgi:hypothetical protein
MRASDFHQIAADDDRPGEIPAQCTVDQWR